jgi:hypothetical protein
MTSIHTPRRQRLHLAVLATLAFAASSAQAVSFDTDNPDLTVRWDNTVKASTAYRLKNANAALTDSTRLLVPGVDASAFPQAVNFNAGDDNFRNRGFVSERLDLLSEFDVVWQRNMGLRLSAAAWYDAAYQGKSAAKDAGNGQSPSNAFNARTKEEAGNKAEWLDAFVFGGWNLGEGSRVTARLGRHALQYGESLFFGDNAIARAQGPIDIAKMLASPNAQFKEVIRPVNQLSAQLQLSPTVSIGGYYQLEWEADRLPAAGSYYSTANTGWGSTFAEYTSITSGALAGNYVLLPGQDHRPSDFGQFGMQLKWRLEDTDLGFYAARYHDKSGQLYGDLNVYSPAASSWYYTFPEAIKVLGMSVSHSVGDFNFAVEGSVRDGMPLRSTNMLYPSAFSGAPRYATGQTAHLNVSTLATFGPSFISRESSLVAELAWNRVLKKNDPDDVIDAGRNRDATALQFIFTPTYRQVVSGLDLSVPFGVRYSLAGRSSITAWDAKGAGNTTLGLDGNYLGVWQFSVAWTHYIGKATPFIDYSPLLTGGSVIYGQGNALADRDTVSLSVRRTF